MNTRHTLIRRALDTGDEEAWAELVKHYERFIYYVMQQFGVVAADQDDIGQQVLMKLLRDLPNYDRSRSKFRSWFGMLIRHAAVDYIRSQNRQRRKVEHFREEMEEFLTSQPSEVEARIEREWAVFIVNEALSRVRAAFKGQAVDVFVMSQDGVSISEIMEKTGLTTQSIYTLRNRVKKRLHLEVAQLTAELEP